MTFDGAPIDRVEHFNIWTPMSGLWAATLTCVTRRPRGLMAVLCLCGMPPSSGNEVAGVQGDGGTCYLLCVTLRREQRLTSHRFRQIRQILNCRWPYGEPMSQSYRNLNFLITSKNSKRFLSTSALPCAPPRGRRAQGSS
jgi:hypothetical protein